MKKNRIILILTAIMTELLFLNNKIINAESFSIKTYEKNVDYISSESGIKLFLNDNGMLTICDQPTNFEDEDYLYIKEYDKNIVCINTIKIEKVYPEFGSFVKDEIGNYYILYGRDRRAPISSAEKDMVLVKYDSNGIETGKCYFNEFLDIPWNVQKTIFNGSKMKIQGDRLYIYYSKNINRGQDDYDQSFIAVFDLDNFVNISKVAPSYMYNRDSDMIIIEDGLVTYDLYNSFKLSKFSKEDDSSIDLLHAKETDQIGGVEKTSKGYIVAGVNEKIKDSKINDIFVETIDENLSVKEKPIYITDYSDKLKYVISNLKIVQSGYNKYVLLWEIDDKIDNNKDTYIAMVDESGNIIEDAKSLGNYSLNSHDDLSYDSKSNKIYYAVKSEDKILINEIDPGAPFIKVSEVKLSEDFIVLNPDETFELSAIVTPEDALDKSITWKSSDETIATVDENGQVLAIKKGQVDIVATSIVDETLSAKCCIEVEEEVIEDNTTSNTTASSIRNTSSNNITTSTKSFERRVVELCNYERARYGLSPLSEDSKLMSLAKVKSQDMVNNNYFSHTSPTYGDIFEMMDSFGVSYSYAGENLARGQRTPEGVVQSWMNSSGHRQNILSSNFTKIGVGIAQNQNGQFFWTQEFTRP